LNEIPSFVYIEGTNIILFGSNETHEGTYNATLTADAGTHAKKLSFPFKSKLLLASQRTWYPLLQCLL
jgi:hypothetical protein